MSKWRRWQLAQRIAVTRDALEEAGLYPFRRYDYKAAAKEEKIAAARARSDGVSLLKAVYGDLEWLLPDTSVMDALFAQPRREPTDIERHAYKSMGFRKP